MKLHLSCDELFDILTAGPYPAQHASADPVVDEHLASCHECRALAEGLKPATHLFREALAAEQHSLPLFRGELPQPAPVQASIQSCFAPLSRGVCCPQSPSWLAAAALFVVCCLVAFGVIMQGGPLRSTAAGSHMDLKYLKSLELAAACYVPAGQIHVAQLAPAEREVHCCSQCHAAKLPQPLRSPHVRLIAESCLACHAK